MKTSVQNMTSNNGNKIANQFIIKDEKNDQTIFQSYDSIIAIKQNCSDGVIVILDINHWDYSKTTSKYRNMFLGETTKETEQKIASGIYKLANLN